MEMKLEEWRNHFQPLLRVRTDDGQGTYSSFMALADETAWDTLHEAGLTREELDEVGTEILKLFGWFPT